ncbi:Centromere protein N [Pitangus sulphuratus]|nr:Centromere protein N [Pitangus sulphuratus]
MAARGAAPSAQRHRTGQGRAARNGGSIMDETVAEYIRRTVLKIPRDEIKMMLQKWGFLSEAQLQTLNFHQLKDNISQEVVQLCEVTITFREYEDNAIWIRVAWGTPYRQPNQYKPSYVVYHSQTPYAFISASVLKSNLPLLCQALIVASNYHDIREMELRSHSLNSLKDIVFKRYSQNFQTYCPKPLQGRAVEPENVDLRIINENRSEKERIHRLNQEAFGDGPQPILQFAQYKLETMFKSSPEMDVLDKKEPFRCLVKFSSPHLLESLKSLAPAAFVKLKLNEDAITEL